MDADGPEAEEQDRGFEAARALADCRNYKGAVDQLRRSLARRPDDAASHALLGLYLHILGRNAEATENCKRALALDPSDARAHRIYGVVLAADRRRRKLGLKQLEQAVALAPLDGYSHYYLATCYGGQGRSKQAAAAYRKAIQLIPSDATILAGAAQFFFASSGVREAQDLARRAFAAGPDDTAALAARARGLLIEGRTSEAFDLARAAILSDAEYRPALEALIEADMRRNLLFSIWFRVRTWTRRGNGRGFLLAFALWFGIAACLILVKKVVPVSSNTLDQVFWIVVGLTLLPGLIYRYRLWAAMRPVKLARRF